MVFGAQSAAAAEVGAAALMQAADQVPAALPGQDPFGQALAGFAVSAGVGGARGVAAGSAPGEEAGDGGDDVLPGTNGDDTLDGGAGNDVMTGVGGNDSLYGGSGDDRLIGGEGDDTLSGDFGICLSDPVGDVGGDTSIGTGNETIDSNGQEVFDTGEANGELINVEAIDVESSSEPEDTLPHRVIPTDDILTEATVYDNAAVMVDEGSLSIDDYSPLADDIGLSLIGGTEDTLATRLDIFDLAY
jgi:Ca2+-binding RTX toxin-like protein